MANEPKKKRQRKREDMVDRPTLGTDTPRERRDVEEPLQRDRDEDSPRPTPRKREDEEP
jgi:hypothetical protein